MKKFMKVLFGIIGVFVVIVIIAAIAGGNSSSSSSNASSQPAVSQPAQAASAPASDPDSELQAMLKAAPAPVITKDDVSMDVAYTLTNNTKDSFDYVQLSIDFYNKAGVKVDSEMTNTQNVTPGQKFQLKVATMTQDASSYKVVGIYSTPH